ncbi:hypothetical protein FB45DRAFT_861868 [Roridomyces roridus]|uniref:Uncharacterized protein n=1 Tax=Roridomyces roridus TaxID=1738132 RepID=A0AAD7CE05_9AGAR|nr:hypothetical protein FB45DRAFT_861868 [Roridomyces roridus]
MIDSVGTFPRLEKLYMLRLGAGELSKPIRVEAPNLRDVSLLYNSLQPWKTALPWAQLTTLRLESDLYTCWEILSYTSNLEVLTMYTENQGSGISSSNRVFNNLVDRSGFTLRKLHLRLRDTLGGVSKGFLQMKSLESVQDLTLVGPTGGTDDLNELFELMSRRVNICLPALEHLCIEECAPAYAEICQLVNMLIARVDCAEGCTQLKSFKFSFSERGDGNRNNFATAGSCLPRRCW